MEKEENLIEIQKANLEGQIRSLVAELDSPTSPIGDWKVIKCYEAKLQEKELPYNLDSLMEERQAVRDQINELQTQLEKLK